MPHTDKPSGFLGLWEISNTNNKRTRRKVASPHPWHKVLMPGFLGTEPRRMRKQQHSVFPRKGTRKKDSIPPHKEFMARESPAHPLPGTLQLACLARGSQEGVSPSRGAEQPAWRPPCPLSKVCMNGLHLESQSSPPASEQGRGRQKGAVFCLFL